MKLDHLKKYLVFVLILTTTTIKAQVNLVGVGFGGGTFNMNSTRELNPRIINQFPFTSVSTSDCPPNFFLKTEALYSFPKYFAVGINFTSTSTRSRFSYAYNTGSYNFENNQNGLFLGNKILVGKAPGKITGINFGLEGGVSFSKMKIVESIQNSNQSISSYSTLTGSAMGFFVQPGVYYFLVLKSQFRFSANASYYIGIEKGYHRLNQINSSLSGQEKQVIPQWDGVRIGVTAYWVFLK